MYKLELEFTLKNRDGEVLQELSRDAEGKAEFNEDGGLKLLTPTARDYLRWVVSGLHASKEEELELFGSAWEKLLSADSEYTDDEVTFLRNALLAIDIFNVNVQKQIMAAIPKVEKIIKDPEGGFEEEAVTVTPSE